MHAPEQPKTNDGGGHEPVTVSAKVLLLSAVGLVVLIAVSMAAMAGYARLLQGDSASTQTEASRSEQRTVRTPLEVDQRTQRKQYEARQRRLLDGYEWRDDNRRSARIPIERAMDMTVQRYRKRDKASGKKQKP